MNLKQLRLTLRGISGRYDLVDADGADRGMNYYINAGVRFLDSNYSGIKGVGHHYQLLPAGTYFAQFERCRAVHEVWVADQDARVKLQKRSRAELLQYYTKPFSEMDKGAPSYYTPISLRNIPEELSADDLTALDFVTQYMDTLSTDHYSYNGVLFLPPTDKQYMLEVVGTFYSRPLTTDTDENFWSVEHENLLVAATMLQIESTHRNSQGVNDWLNVIAAHLDGINKDLAEQEAADVDQMRG